MPAFHVVVHPRPDNAPSRALAPLHGLFDVIVDGVNITAKIGEGVALSLLADLAGAVAQLAAGRRARAFLPLYAADEVWELGLEASAADVLLTVYRTSPTAEVAVFERRVTLTALRDGVLSALSEALDKSGIPASIRQALEQQARALDAAWPPVPRIARSTRSLQLAADCRSDLTFRITGDFRRPVEPPVRHERRAEVERADLHALLMRGTVVIAVRDRESCLEPTHPFLVVERLLALAADGLEALQHSRPVFRRIEVGPARIGIRRGPGDAPMDLSVSAPSIKGAAGRLTYPAVDVTAFARGVASLARQLADAFIDTDPSQQHNLRLKSLVLAAEALEDRIEDAVCDDSLTNPEPETYRPFAPRKRARTSRGVWSHGGKMRFLPRWVATVPQIDLRATFLCGERIVVGAGREIACLERASGSIIWKAVTSPGGSVVTPSGLARIAPDGHIVLFDLPTGEVRFSTRIVPRSAGGATGAVVHAPGLPRLLVVAEGDRRITAIDLVSGDVRWRYVGRRPAAYRLRRAGKLLLVTGGDSALFALDVESGDVVWRVRDRLPFAPAIALDHDAAFALSGSAGGPYRLHHLDPWTGAVRFSVTVDDPPAQNQPPLITPHAVVVPVIDRAGVGAKAFCRSSGDVLWEHAPGLASPITAWMAVDDAVIANSDAGILFCLDGRTGITRYSHVFSRNTDADQPRRLEPVLRSGALFVPQHEVHVVRPRDGEVIGSVPSDLVPDLIRVDEHCNVYIAEESGHVAAFGVAPRLTLVK